MANEIAPISVKFTVDTTGLKKAESAISQSGEQIKGKFAGIGKGAGLALAAGVTAAAITIGRKVGSFLSSSVDEAVNLEESLNAVKVTFGEAADSIVALGDNSATRIGLSQSKFNAVAVQFSSFAGTIAGEGGDISSVIDDLSTRGADFASVMNLQGGVNEALSKFQSGLAGQTEPLRQYGIDLSAAKVEAFAYANGIAQVGEKLTEEQKVQARYGSLMEQTIKTQGDFANTSGGLANTLRIQQEQMANLKAEIGNELVPVQLELTKAFMDVLPTLKDNLIPAIKDLAEKFKTDVLPAIITLLPVAVTLFTLLAENIETVIAVVGAIGALSAIVKTFTMIQAALNLVLFGNPILLVVAAVALLVAGIVYLATQTTFFQDTWQRLADTFSYVKAVIADTFENAMATIGDFFDTIFGFLNGLGDQLYSFGKTAWEMFVQGALDALLTLPSLVADVVGSIPGLEFLGDGINSGIGAIRDTVSSATGTTNRGQTNQQPRGQVVNNYNVQARGLTVSEVARDAKRRSNLMSPVLGGA